MGALRIVGTRVAGLDVMDVASGAGVAVGIVALVGFVAILLPVRRAAGVDPAVVLRAE